MKNYTQWRQSFFKSIHLQLFISFISLPFLIGWGLPISLLTPISTLIFGPFLTCFLLTSSIIFFLEILYLPNMFFIKCLEYITTIWIFCLDLEQKTWLIAFAKPPLFILFLLPLLALAIVHNKKITSITKQIGFLIILLITTCFILKFFPYSLLRNALTTIPCNNGTITMIHHNKNLIIIDPGFIAARPSYESFISYTLLPAIIEQTGCMHIDHLIMFKFNKRILEAVQFLSTKITIKNIYIPAWKGKIPLCAWRSYATLKQIISAQKGKIISIFYKKRIYNDTHCSLFIEPITKKNIKYYEATYQPLYLHGTLNNQSLSM